MAPSSRTLRTGVGPCSPFTRARLRRWPAHALTLAFAACASGRLEAGVYRDAYTAYHVGPVPSHWRSIRFHDNDVTYVSKSSPHAISVNSTCKEYRDAPLEILTRHLLIGFTEEVLSSKRLIPLDGREALETRATAKLDGVPVELILVVLKKDGCIYDFTYVSPPGALDDELETFEAVLAAFHTGARA